MVIYSPYILSTALGPDLDFLSHCYTCFCACTVTRMLHYGTTHLVSPKRHEYVRHLVGRDAGETIGQTYFRTVRLCAPKASYTSYSAGKSQFMAARELRNSTCFTVLVVLYHGYSILRTFVRYGRVRKARSASCFVRQC